MKAVIRNRLDAGSLTICGDWFYAESITPQPGEGYRYTVFTWHAPSVLQKLRQFDEDFGRYMVESGGKVNSSRQTAIRAVKGEMAGIVS